MRTHDLKRFSPVMEKALTLMLTRGPIRNHGGGYWAPSNWNHDDVLDRDNWVTRNTLYALVKRDLALARQNHVWRETEYVITAAGMMLLTGAVG